jgi:hypothetical protein
MAVHVRSASPFATAWMTAGARNGHGARMGVFETADGSALATGFRCIMPWIDQRHTSRIEIGHIPGDDGHIYARAR